MREGNLATVAAVLCTHNYEAFIEECLDSVANQTRSIDELIIVDSGSTDETLRKIAAWINSNRGHFDISLVEAINLGPSRARNIGIYRSRSDFVAFLDGDDRWEPEKIRLQLRLFEEDFDGNLGLVYGDYVTLHQRLDGRWEEEHSKLPPFARGSIFALLAEGNYISGSASAVMVPRKVLMDVGLFDEKLGFAEDWDLWRRISARYNVEFVSNVISKIRIRGGSWSTNPTLVEDEVAHFVKWWQLSEFHRGRYIQIVRRIYECAVRPSGMTTLPLIPRILFSRPTTTVIGFCDEFWRKAGRFTRRRVQKYLGVQP